ncbi:transcription termination/antitermination protein NusG [Thermonema rossianum]|uniref:transcription termination/antitermination protein NusG n=1 Tax=Thermonema rossianum TaxID=55505 RepID=UPI00056EF992|nr:transcription termination/antitermination protein NusG [Thermonema rossianum]
METHKWYVLRAIAGQEKKVKTYIENEIARQGWQEQVKEVFIPTEKVYEVRNGKKKIREKIFLPGYVLILADLSQPELVHTLTSLPGVIGFLQEEARAGENPKDGYVKQPIPLRDSEVNRILGKADESQEAERLETPFMVGEHVKVADGPFSGFDGVIDQVFEDRKKLNVIVKIFGRSTPVELSYTQVEKLD